MKIETTVVVSVSKERRQLLRFKRSELEAMWRQALGGSTWKKIDFIKLLREHIASRADGFWISLKEAKDVADWLEGELNTHSREDRS